MMLLLTSTGKELPEPTGSQAARPLQHPQHMWVGEGRAGGSTGEIPLKEMSAGIWGAAATVTSVSGRNQLPGRREGKFGGKQPSGKGDQSTPARPPTRAATATRSRPLLAPFTFRSPWTPYLFPPGSPSSRSSSSNSSAPRTAAAILSGGTRETRKKGGNNRSSHWRAAPQRRRRKRLCHWSERAGQPISSQGKLQVQPFGGDGIAAGSRMAHAQLLLHVPDRMVGQARARQDAPPGRGLGEGKGQP